MTVTPLGRLFVSRRDPCTPVAIRDGAPLSFGRFAADVGHMAGIVRKRGVRRAAVVSADPYRFLVGFFGVMHAGAAVVLPPDNLPDTLIGLRDRFDLLLCDDEASAQVPALAIPEGRPGPPAGEIDPEPTMLEFFTSGSTGVAKRIVKPLVMLDREIATLDALWGATAGRSPTLSTVPYRHIFGLTFHLLWPLASSRPFASHVDVLLEPLLARGVRDVDLVTSPAHLARLAGLASLAPDRRPARILTAGAPLHLAQAREVAQVLGVPPTEIFGSTETGAIATRTQHVAHEPWTPLPGIAVDADPDGCMIVRSPYGPGGVPFVSADRVEMLPDGRFHFLGRADRIAKIEGKRVSLAGLEEALVALLCVSDAAAVVLDGFPERLAAAVVLKGDGPERLATLGSFRFSRELRRQLAQQFESAWLPKSWRFLDELPHGAMGKRRDADVKALFTPDRDGRP